MAFVGREIKSKEQKKQKMKEMRRVLLKALLLALTMGESQCFTKSARTRAVRMDKEMLTQARAIPKDSSNDRNISAFGRQWFLCLFGY